MSTIPEGIFNSELARRNSAKRKTKSGGVVWGQHNPDTLRCRCADCSVKREERRAEEAEIPKRPQGRPPKEPVVTVKRPQGRPRLHPEIDPVAPKRPRGRPRKVA
jgi:hypothetical protein